MQENQDRQMKNKKNLEKYFCGKKIHFFLLNFLNQNLIKFKFVWKNRQIIFFNSTKKILSRFCAFMLSPRGLNLIFIIFLLIINLRYLN